MVKRYKREFDYSYTLGMAPTIELITFAQELALCVYVHPDYKPETEPDIFAICAACGIACDINRKVFNILADKENTFVIGVFRKQYSKLSSDMPHMVFVNPGDAGNLGTNLRTCAGFGFLDIVTVAPGADIYSPKTVRASMGAVFHMRHCVFSSIEEYVGTFPNHEKYFFMLNGKTKLTEIQYRKETEHHNQSIASARRFSLVFGNEATGLPDTCLNMGLSVRIEHSANIDSLNLSVAVGIAAHAFYK